MRAAAVVGAHSMDKWHRVETANNLNLYLKVSRISKDALGVVFRYNGQELAYCEDGYAEFRNISQWTAKQVHIAQDIVGKSEDDGFSITHRNGTVYICGDPAVGDTHRVRIHADSQTWNTVSS